jgi:hypothetical protein
METRKTTSPHNTIPVDKYICGVGNCLKKDTNITRLNQHRQTHQTRSILRVSNNSAFKRISNIVLTSPDTYRSLISEPPIVSSPLNQ